MLLHFLLLFLLLPNVSHSIPDASLQLALTTLRSTGRTLFPNAILTSDLRYALTASPSSSFTLLAPPDPDLFALDLVSAAPDYVAALSRHVIQGRFTVSDLKALKRVGGGMEVGVGRWNGTEVVTVDGARVVEGDLVLMEGLVVHGVERVVLKLNGGWTREAEDDAFWGVVGVPDLKGVGDDDGSGVIDSDRVSPGPDPVMDSDSPRTWDSTALGPDPGSWGSVSWAPAPAMMDPGSFGSDPWSPAPATIDLGGFDSDWSDFGPAVVDPGRLYPDPRAPGPAVVDPGRMISDPRAPEPAVVDPGRMFSDPRAPGPAIVDPVGKGSMDSDLGGLDSDPSISTPAVVVHRKRSSDRKKGKKKSRKSKRKAHKDLKFDL